LTGGAAGVGARAAGAALGRPALTGELLGGRLVVRDAVDVAEAYPALCKAEAERRDRQAPVVLYAAKALLGGGGDELAVLEQAARGLVIIRRDADDVHRERKAPGTARARFIVDDRLAAFHDPRRSR